MKALITYGFLIITGFANSQGLNKSDLTNTVWFTDNFNRAFYTADTIKLFRVTDTLTDFQRRNVIYRAIDYNGGKSITTIKLKKGGKAEIADHDVETWLQASKAGKWRWRYDAAAKKLSFLFNKKPRYSFLFIESGTDKLVWTYEEYAAKVSIEDIFHLTILEFVRLNQLQ